MPSHAFDVTQKSQFIKAGAGAGKTTRLIKTFLEFVKEFKQNNKRFPRVVMTTFTRKATQEVKERLLVSALKADEKEVFEYISQKSFVHISTIHGLLSLFLNQYSEKIKFPQDVKIVDTVQFERALKKQMNELLKKNSNYLELLESFSFNKLVDISIKALETKAQYRNMTFLPSSELKKIATTHKNGIIETVDQILKAETSPQKSWIGYFDYLRQIQQTVKTGTREELEQVIEDGPNKPQFKPDKPSVAPEAHDLVLLLKNELLDNLFDSDEYIEKHEKLNQLFNDFINTLYQISFDHKRRTGEMTISDLETISLQIIEEHPEAAQEFSDSWDYFMIDEYQDTSPLQVKILDQLIRDKTCFVVGDPQQSIYLFRGARSEVFETKQKQMLAKNAQVDFLETNFRSEPTLMSFINQFFTDFSTQFKPMILKSEASNSKVSSHDAYYIKTEDQALGTLLQIQALIKAGASPQDICVLSRSNKNLLDVALLANTVGVHVQLQAASGFEDKREILDLISFNKFLNNPHDDENFITLVRSPWFYIDDETLVNVAQKRQRASFWSVLAAEKPELAKYLNLFNTSGVSQATQKFLIDTEFVNFSEYYDPTGKREANIFKYLNNLILAEQKVGFSLGQFLEEQFESISLDSGSSNSEAQPVVQPNCVSLMTVHASKGLQFKHVIVLGFADIIKTSNTPEFSFDTQTQKFSLSVFNDALGKLEPSSWARGLREEFVKREMNESERVLYVAMTRAIESLSLVAEVSKRKNSNTWFAKIAWPEAGEFIGENFKTKSLVFDEDLDVIEAQKKTAVNLRSKFQTTENVAGGASQSITELISQKSDFSQQAPAYYEMQLKNLKKAQRGTDLHRVFESLKYLDQEKIKRILNSEDLEAVNYLLGLKEINLLEILKAGHNEWGFGLKTSKRFIQGQIDLWGETSDAVHVLDYKTGSSDYSDKAFEQLAIYSKALYEMKMIPVWKKLVHTVVYPVEKTIKQKVFSGAAEFDKALDLKIKEIF